MRICSHLKIISSRRVKLYNLDKTFKRFFLLDTFFFVVIICKYFKNKKHVMTQGDAIDHMLRFSYLLIFHKALNHFHGYVYTITKQKKMKSL